MVIPVPRQSDLCQGFFSLSSSRKLPCTYHVVPSPLMLATTKEHEESYLIGRGNQNANILTNEFLWIKIAKQKRCIVSYAHNDAIYCAGDQSLSCFQTLHWTLEHGKSNQTQTAYNHQCLMSVSVLPSPNRHRPLTIISGNPEIPFRNFESRFRAGSGCTR